MPPKESDPSSTETEPGNKKTGTEFQAADGGIHAWLIVVASFLTNGIIFGIHNCYGVLYVWLKKELEDHNVPDAATKCSLVGSLSIGMTFFTSPLAGILIDTWGLRKTAFLGGAIATTGMLASSFALGHVEALYVTYGILFGAGTSLTYNPSLVILGHYFQKKLGLVNGLVTAGSSVFTIALPFLLDGALASLGLASTLQILAGVMAVLMLCSLTFIPQLPAPAESGEAPGADRKNLRQYLRRIVNVSIWKNKKYIIWAIAVPFSMFGYFVPYVHLVAYVKDILPDADGKLLVLCIGITSGIGRLIFGKVADLPQVNRIVLQQVAFTVIGSLTMLLTLANSFTWLIIICLGMGISDGCFVALVGPIAFDLCGTKSASQALGFLLGLYAVPMTTGPPVSGALYDALGSYREAFLLAGCPPIIGALIMCLISRVKSAPNPDEELAAADQETIKRKMSSKAAPQQVDPDSYSPVYVTASETSKSSPQASERSGSPAVLQVSSSQFSSSPTNRAASAAVDSKSKNKVQLTGYSTTASAILW